MIICQEKRLIQEDQKSEEKFSRKVHLRSSLVDRMLKVMLDTNILVDFVLVAWKLNKKQPIPKHLKRSEDIFARYELNQFQNVMSDWNTFELRDKIFELRLNQKLIENGYSPTEFQMAKREIRLTKEEREGVNEVIRELRRHATQETEHINLNMVRDWTEKGFSFMDIVLLHQACLNRCKYFITRDKELIITNNELKKSFPIKIIGIPEFLEILERDDNAP